MNQEAFEQSIVQLQQSWLELGRRFFVDSDDDARDALQETLLRLWVVRQRLETFAEVRALGTSIMKNECINICRRRQRRADLPPPDLPSMESNPHALLAKREDSELLQWAIENLPLQSRCLLQLQIYEGMSLDEISERTGKTKGSVKAMISKAKGKIRRWIKSQE